MRTAELATPKSVQTDGWTAATRFLVPPNLASCLMAPSRLLSICLLLAISTLRDCPIKKKPFITAQQRGETDTHRIAGRRQALLEPIPLQTSLRPLQEMRTRRWHRTTATVAAVTRNTWAADSGSSSIAVASGVGKKKRHGGGGDDFRLRLGHASSQRSGFANGLLAHFGSGRCGPDSSFVVCRRCLCERKRGRRMSS